VMRLVLAAAVVVAALAVPASAAQLDPKTLVVRPADVPAGFELVADQSGVRSNARRASMYPAGRRPPLARFGRLTGYDAVYWRKPSAVIGSSADLYRAAEGVDRFMRWWKEDVRSRGTKGQQVTSTWIGVRAWVTKQRVRDGSGTTLYTTVSWRDGRVTAGVVGKGVPAATVVRLARAQHRRIAAALD
jgi:hypothetical protein